jgi:hypothetical protein
VAQLFKATLRVAGRRVGGAELRRGDSLTLLEDSKQLATCRAAPDVWNVRAIKGFDGSAVAELPPVGKARITAAIDGVYTALFRALRAHTQRVANLKGPERLALTAKIRDNWPVIVELLDSVLEGGRASFEDELAGKVEAAKAEVAAGAELVAAELLAAGEALNEAADEIAAQHARIAELEAAAVDLAGEIDARIVRIGELEQQLAEPQAERPGAFRDQETGAFTDDADRDADGFTEPEAAFLAALEQLDACSMDELEELAEAAGHEIRSKDKRTRAKLVARCAELAALIRAASLEEPAGDGGDDSNPDADPGDDDDATTDGTGAAGAAE